MKRNNLQSFRSFRRLSWIFKICSTWGRTYTDVASHLEDLRRPLRSFSINRNRFNVDIQLPVIPIKDWKSIMRASITTSALCAPRPDPQFILMRALHPFSWHRQNIETVSSHWNPLVKQINRLNMVELLNRFRRVFSLWQTCSYLLFCLIHRTASNDVIFLDVNGERLARSAWITIARCWFCPDWSSVPEPLGSH